MTIAKVARYEVTGIERETQLVPGGTIDHLATVGWYWKPKCDRFYRTWREGRVLSNLIQQ
jgi:hypothetical protein